MGKLIYRGFVNLDESISPQVSIITGANLKKREKPVKQNPNKESKKERREIDG